METWKSFILLIYILANVVAVLFMMGELDDIKKRDKNVNVGHLITMLIFLPSTILLGIMLLVCELIFYIVDLIEPILKKTVIKRK